MKHLKMIMYRGLHESLIYFWSKPSFHSSKKLKKLRDMFPASAWGRRRVRGCFSEGKLSCINSVLVWWDKKDEVTHQSQVKPALAACIICTVQWSDRRSKGIKAVPEKMVCVGRLLGVTSPVLKLWFTSFPHRTAKERCSRSVHGGENGCRWKWGYSHLTLCLYLPSPSCRISFEIHRGRLVATSPQY